MFALPALPYAPCAMRRLTSPRYQMPNLKTNDIYDIVMLKCPCSSPNPKILRDEKLPRANKKKIVLDALHPARKHLPRVESPATPLCARPPYHTLTGSCTDPAPAPLVPETLTHSPDHVSRSPRRIATPVKTTDACNPATPHAAREARYQTAFRTWLFSLRTLNRRRYRFIRDFPLPL